MHLDRQPDGGDVKTTRTDKSGTAGTAAQVDGAEGADADSGELSDEDSSASVGGVELHGMFPVMGGAEGEEDSSEEDSDSSPLGPFQGPFPGQHCKVRNTRHVAY